jgi:hypothetical protein
LTAFALLLMEPLKYLVGYPPHVLARVQALLEQGRLGKVLEDRYGQMHTVRTDGQLYDYVQALKDRHLRQSVPLGKVIYDSKLQVMKHALGTHTSDFARAGRQAQGQPRDPHRHRVPRCAGGFPEDDRGARAGAPEGSRARQGVLSLCTHMEAEYHQLEFDLRLYLTQLEIGQGR